MGIGRQVLQRAITNTCKMVGLNQRTVLFGAGLLASGLYLDWQFRGWDRMADEALTIAFHSLFPAFGFGALALLWNLWLAPFEVLSEGIKLNPGTEEAAAKVDPDYRAWAARKGITLYQASCLMAGFEPGSRVGSAQAANYRGLLIEAVFEKELTIRNGIFQMRNGQAPTLDRVLAWPEAANAELLELDGLLSFLEKKELAPELVKAIRAHRGK